MRKIFTLFLTLLSLPVIGQTQSETIKRANELIADKKFETAFTLLDSYDPTNDKPDIVLLKEDILLNYFVTSIMHQMFALTDININEDILDYRGRDGAYSMQMFQVDSILTRLIRIDPTNCKLYKGLGDYYYDAHLRYGDNWLKNNKEQFELMQTNYQKAVDGDCADYLSHYVLGYVNLAQEKISESISHFLKSIEINTNYATSHYNLAYAYLFTDDRKNALPHAKKALDLYEDTNYKSDAARMVGQIYTELDDKENAITYYETADKINPENYYNIEPLLNLYVKTDNKKAIETTNTFFNLAPANPTIYNDLEKIYISNGKANDLTDFYKSQFIKFKDNDKVTGNLNFYLGRIYLQTDKILAKEYFSAANEVFKKVFANDHAVFNAINDGIKQCEK